MALTAAPWRQDRFAARTLPHVFAFAFAATLGGKGPVSERRGSLLARYSSKNAIGAVPAPDLALVGELVGDGPGVDVAVVRSDDSVRPIEKTR